MLDILIIAHFTQVPGEVGNGRFQYIADKIDKNNATVEVITTSFSHKTKKKRVVTSEQIKSINYKLTMIYEPGYKKNVSLRRFYSHYIMGKNLNRYLRNRKKPDVIYCAVPSLDVAHVAAKYAKKNNIRFIIDIQDLWPEAFKMIFNTSIISNIIFWPMKCKADYIYRAADEIVAVSKTYVDRALDVNLNCNKAYDVFLGTELSYFDKMLEQNKVVREKSNEIWIGYIGTLGHSYDLISVIDAIKLLKNKGYITIRFIVMGDGPLKSKFENYAKKQGINTEFMGRLDYGKMVGTLVACDIAVNPIKKGSAGSVINKVGDYAAAGLPVINTQECKEYRNLLEEYNAGYNCVNGDIEDIADKIIRLCNKDEREKLGFNSRKMAKELFDREPTHKRIFELIKHD